MYYKSCPYCGANLDPNEKCDCQESISEYGIKKKKSSMRNEHIKDKPTIGAFCITDINSIAPITS